MFEFVICTSIIIHNGYQVSLVVASSKRFIIIIIIMLIAVLEYDFAFTQGEWMVVRQKLNILTGSS